MPEYGNRSLTMPPSKEVVDLTEMEDSEMEDVQATKTSDRSDASSELSDAPSYPEDPRHLDRPLKFTQLVDMIVGVANVKFSLYPSLINKNSGLLKTVIGVEPGNASIDLSEEDPAAFDTYVMCICFGPYFSPHEAPQMKRSSKLTISRSSLQMRFPPICSSTGYWHTASRSRHSRQRGILI